MIVDWGGKLNGELAGNNLVLYFLSESFLNLLEYLLSKLVNIFEEVGSDFVDKF